MTQTVVVIGGGIIGLSTATALAQKGYQVSLLDKNTKLGSESSLAGAGILCPLHPWKYANTLHHIASASLELYQDWSTQLHSATGINPELLNSGMLYALSNDEAVTASTWLSSREAKYIGKHHWLTYAQALAINPHISPMQNDQKWLWLPDIKQVRNPLLLQSSIKFAEQHAVRIVTEVNIDSTNIQTDTNGKQYIDFIVDSNGKQWHADQFVWCSGAWTGHLTNDTPLPATHTIKPIKGQMLLFKMPSNWMPNMVMHNDCYIVPRCDGHILVGASIEDVGFDKKTTDTAKTQLLNKLAVLCPTLAAASIVKQWAGLRPFANDDNIPYIGAIPDISNGWINSGHYRYGILLAPYSAKRIASLLPTNHL